MLSNTTTSTLKKISISLGSLLFFAIIIGVIIYAQVLWKQYKERPTSVSEVGVKKNPNDAIETTPIPAEDQLRMMEKLVSDDLPPISLEDSQKMMDRLDDTKPVN